MRWVQYGRCTWEAGHDMKQTAEAIICKPTDLTATSLGWAVVYIHERSNGYVVFEASLLGLLLKLCTMNRSV